jgi:hypothetical protein
MTILATEVHKAKLLIESACPVQEIYDTELYTNSSQTYQLTEFQVGRVQNKNRTRNKNRKCYVKLMAILATEVHKAKLLTELSVTNFTQPQDKTNYQVGIDISSYSRTELTVSANVSELNFS